MRTRTEHQRHRERDRSPADSARGRQREPRPYRQRHRHRDPSAHDAGEVRSSCQRSGTADRGFGREEASTRLTERARPGQRFEAGRASDIDCSSVKYSSPWVVTALTYQFARPAGPSCDTGNATAPTGDS